MDINVKYHLGRNTKWYGLIYLPCFTDSVFFLSAALFPYAIAINAKMAIKVKAKLIVFI